MPRGERSQKQQQLRKSCGWFLYRENPGAMSVLRAFKAVDLFKFNNV
jgi:hypothetical protein